MKAAFRYGRGARGASWQLLAISLFFAADACSAPLAAGGSIVATTDYVYRGLTQTERKAALQVDAHLQSPSGWFLGAWGSVATSATQVQSRSEINLYLGRVWTLSDSWSASAHYARYIYPDDRAAPSYYYHDYDEVQAAVSYEDRATLSVAYAPGIKRFSRYVPGLRRGDQIAYELSLRQPLWRNISLTAGIGHYDLSDLFHHSYWAASGGAELAVDRLTVTFTAFAVDGAARTLFGPRSADGRSALTVAWRF
jgi:uncharacterized protein (TIGR02001 family)